MKRKKISRKERATVEQGGKIQVMILEKNYLPIFDMHFLRSFINTTFFGVLLCFFFFFSLSVLLSFDGARENSISKIITLAYDLMQFIQRGTVYRGTIKSRKQKTTGKMEERLQTVRWKAVNRSR